MAAAASAPLFNCFGSSRLQDVIEKDSRFRDHVVSTGKRFAVTVYWLDFDSIYDGKTMLTDFLEAHIGSSGLEVSFENT